MSALKMGELFAGYGGLGMGVAEVLDVDLAWVSEFDKGPSKVLAHRFPGVPNHGDITKIDWSQVEPVDVLTGGSPCQDLSHAGARKGMTEGTRSNLWVAMREAIAQLQPGLVVWENVRGAYSAGADSAVEPCAGCVGDGSGVHLRALGRVLGDLSELGYDAQWHGLRAADVGAPHGRFRVFVVAYPRGLRPLAERVYAGQSPEPQPSDSGAALGWGHAEANGQAAGSTSLLPSPAAYDGERGGPQHPDKRLAGGHSVTLQDAVYGLLPTPTTRDHKDHTIRREPHRPDDMDTLARALTVTLLPTPTTMDYKASGGNPNTTGSHGTTLTDATAREPQNWGQYAAAIHRWESLTRLAPAPTETGPKGNPRLSAAFSEWMMGVPAGWITDVPGITRNEALKLAGNGVVPQQCEAALRIMLARMSEVAA